MLHALKEGIITKTKPSSDIEVLTRAKEKARVRVEEDPNAGNLAALEKASRMLSGAEDEPFFDDRMKALKHLQHLGYGTNRGIIQKSKLYKDAAPGPKQLLKVQPDGSVLEKDLMVYITVAGLKKPDRPGGDAPEILAKKAQAELDKILEQTEEIRFKREVNQGKYILRTAFEQELAARTAVLEAGLRYMAQTRIADWIALVDGNIKKRPRLLNTINEDLDEKLNEFATMDRYQVIVLEDETEAHNVS